MYIADVIKTKRREKGLTQEAMAQRLGVTTPAVSKWENGNSLPDISLLSPIARLLDISLDTLLCHEKELSDAEANSLVEQLLARFETKSLDDNFLWMKQCIEKYPSSHFLILWMAQVFYGKLCEDTTAEREKYEGYIAECYERVLESEDSGMKRSAASALYHFYLAQAKYSEAERYLAYISDENPDRKQKLAYIYSQTGREDEAIKMYEELLYAAYQSMNASLQGSYIMAMRAEELEKAHFLVDKQRGIAALLEFGEFHELSPGLELAIEEKDEAETLRIAECMLTNTKSIGGFTESALFSHMGLKSLGEDYLSKVREDLLEGFRDEASYSYMRGNASWRSLIL